ncbi:MAG: lipase [Clostridiales bacterium]|nr:lipase [Clostridiales bacterium]
MGGNEMDQHWVAAWGVAPSLKEALPAEYAKDITLRYILKMGIGGKGLRLHFSNLFNEEETVITRATVQLQGQEGPVYPVLFGGKSQGVLPAQGEGESDPIEMNILPGMDVAVSLYFGEMTHLASGVSSSGPLCIGSFAKGDRCDEKEFALTWAKDNGWFCFLDRADVLADADAHALVAFGDSITAQSWPDWLALRLIDEKNEKLSVVRRGISGSRVLRQYSHLQHKHYGPSGASRFEREVCVPGVDRVIVLHGVNDVIHPDGVHPCRPWSDLPTAEELIEGLRAYIRLAHAHGLKIYLATITPIQGWRTETSMRTEICQQVNQWIRENKEADGVADFAAAVWNPENHLALLPACDSGDHLHPSVEGAKRMAHSIPGEYLK